MSQLDPNALCFCDNGKKIKFCCKDIFADLDKIVRAMEGKQYEAAGRYIDQTLAKHPDRASLWLLKFELLNHRPQLGPEVILEFARDFLAAAPNSAAALALHAVVDASVATEIDVPADRQQPLNEAARKVHLALETTKGESIIPHSVANALVALGQSFLETSHWMAGVEHLRQQTLRNRVANDGLRIYAQVLQSKNLPLLFKQGLPLPPPANWVKWKNEYVQLLAIAHRGGWTQVADKIESLIQSNEPHPTLVRAYAALCCRLPDHPRAVAALKALAEQRDTTQDEAAIAWATALLLDDSLLGSIAVKRQTVTVLDAEKFSEAMLSSPLVHARPVRKEDSADGLTPRAAYALYDRPAPTTIAGMTVHDLVAEAGLLTLYGKQTDRDAFVEIAFADIHPSSPLETLREIHGENLGTVEATEDMVSLPPFLVLSKLPILVPPDVRDAATQAQFDAIERQWIVERLVSFPCALFDGQTPLGVAADPLYRKRLLGWLLSVEESADYAAATTQLLYERIGLPLPHLPPALVGKPIPDVPLSRLHFVPTESLSDADLEFGLSWARQHAAVEASKHFAAAILSREHLNKSLAFGTLASYEPDLDKALEFNLQAQRAARAAEQSPAWYMLHEIRLRVGRGEVQAATRLFQEIQSKYLEEPGIGPEMMKLLQQLGMIDAQGNRIERSPAKGEATPATTASELWTPDDEAAVAASGQASGSESKLWLPGMD